MSLFYLVTHFGYPLIFLITIVEGPLITMFGAFLASLGYLNVFIVFVVVVLGDLAGDLLWYLVGRTGRKHFVEKYGHYLGITSERIIRLEQFFHKNAPRTIFLAKITHAVGLPFIIAAGISKVNFRLFSWYSFLATLPKSLALVLIGYYLGNTYIKVNNLLTYLPVAAVALLIVYGVVYFLHHKYQKYYENTDRG